METRDIVLPYMWQPRPYQQRLWDYLKGGGLRAVECAHRRWGKDDVALHHTACKAHQRPGNYGHMLPKYEQGRKAIWDALRPYNAGDPMSGKKRIDVAFPLEIRRRTNEQEMKIEFKNGSTWQVLGSDNYNSLMGTSYAGLVLSEDAQANPSAWGYFSPILRENKGWALFISTPRGRNHFHALLETAKKQPGWFWEVSTVEQTQALQQWELDEELAVSQGRYGGDYGLAIFRQEFYCSFDAAIPGSIWGDCVKAAEDAGRVLDFAIDPTQPVQTAWDLGRTDDTAIWWYQITPTRIDVFDHHSSSLKDMPFYMNLLDEKRQHHGCTYGTHYLPHDARPRTLAAGGKSILQQCHDAAKANATLGRFVIGKRLDVQEGIQAGRATFPFCRFHKTRTEKGLNSLRQYHREYDDEKKCFRDQPEHDWCLAGDSLVLTPTGWREIQSLTVHDQVLTPSGTRAILRTGIVRWTNDWADVRGIACTKEHQFFTNRGLVKAEDVSPRDALWTRDSWGLRILASWSATLRFGLKDAIISATREARKNQQNATACSFIGWCMRLCMVRFRQIMKSIMQTTIRSITIQTTCVPSRSSFIAATISPSLATTVRASSVVQGFSVINTSPIHAQSAVVAPSMPMSNAHAEPAYNLTVDHDHCYFALGADGKEYLVANSSHDADAFRYLSLSWKRTDAAKPDSPLVDKLLAHNPSAMAFGALKAQHFAKMRRQREARA